MSTETYSARDVLLFTTGKKSAPSSIEYADGDDLPFVVAAVNSERWWAEPQTTAIRAALAKLHQHPIALYSKSTLGFLESMTREWTALANDIAFRVRSVRSKKSSIQYKAKSYAEALKQAIELYANGPFDAEWDIATALGEFAFEEKRKNGAPVIKLLREGVSCIRMSVCFNQSLNPNWIKEKCTNTCNTHVPLIELAEKFNLSFSVTAAPITSKITRVSKITFGKVYGSNIPLFDDNAIAGRIAWDYKGIRSLITDKVYPIQMYRLLQSQLETFPSIHEYNKIGIR
jgi:hypothetical protein